jgi:propanol-preferring alcohol dehydrogenase
VIMFSGLPTFGSAIAGADPVPMVFKGFTITSSLVANQMYTDEALDFAARGLINPHLKVYPFKDLPGKVLELRESKIAGRAVIDFNS